MQTIAPCLWLDGQAEAAADFYVSVFPRSRIVDVMRATAAGPDTPGGVQSVRFELDGTEFEARNGGLQGHAPAAISLLVQCETQDEAERLRAGLLGGGQPRPDGGLTDRYGVIWQIEAPRRDVDPVPRPEGATPYLIIKGASDAIGWYERNFGAQLVMRLDAPDGSVLHAEMKVGPARFMLTEEHPEFRSLSPLTLGGSASTALIYVPDADAVIERAHAAGAKIMMPVADQFWGDRSGSLVDPYGHQWFISSRIETPTQEEVRRRVEALFLSGKPGC